MLDTAALHLFDDGWLIFGCVAFGAPMPAAYGAWGMIRDVRPNVSVCVAAICDTPRLSVCVRVAYTLGDEYGGFQPPARLCLRHTPRGGMIGDVRPNVFTCGAAMLRIRRAFGAPMPAAYGSLARQARQASGFI